MSIFKQQTGKPFLISSLTLAISTILFPTQSAFAAECSATNGTWSNLSSACELSNASSGTVTVNNGGPVIGIASNDILVDGLNLTVNNQSGGELHTYRIWGNYTGSINNTSLTITPDSSRHSQSFGVLVRNGGTLNATGDLNLNLTHHNNNNDRTAASYAIAAGAAGDPWQDRAANAFSRINLENTNITMSATANSRLPTKTVRIPFFGNIALKSGGYLLNGMRAMRNEGNYGSTPEITVNGKAVINLTDNGPSGYMVGAYASGTGSKITLNNTDITLHKGTSQSYFIELMASALKIGKLRGDATGSGTIESKGTLNINTTELTKAPSIRLLGDNSVLKADFDNSQGTIKSGSSAVIYDVYDITPALKSMASSGGFDDYSASGSNQSVSLKNMVMTTTSEVDPLIIANVDSDDDDTVKSASFSLSGANSQATANDKGWLMYVKKASADASDLTANVSNGAVITGMVHREVEDAVAANLTLNLDNATWNLKKKEEAASTGNFTVVKDASKTSTATAVSLTNQAVLNASQLASEDDGISGKYTIETPLFTSVNSTINLHNQSHQDELTINGDYKGDNAFVRMNTDWNAPGDEQGTDSTSDVLHITGSASGSTTVLPVALDGRENLITGSIKQVEEKTFNTVAVVKVDGADDGSAFNGLANTEYAGQVRLVNRATAAGGREYYWTLYTPKGALILRPRVAVYTQAPKANLEQGFTNLASLHERRGENQALAWDCDCAGHQAKGQTWVRLIGKKLSLDGKNRFGMDLDQYGFQVGLDFRIQHNAETGSRNHTGIFAGFMRGSTEFFDYARLDANLNKYAGKMKSDFGSLGLSHTRYAKNGAYVDLVGQIGFLRNHYKPAETPQNATQNGYNFALSVEVGRPYAIKETQWLIEPQAQLMYQFLHLGNFADDTYQVNQANEQGLRGRAGVRLAHNSAYGPRTKSFYLSANVLHDFTNPKAVQVGTGKYQERYSNTWWELGLGAQIPTSLNSYIYANGFYEQSFNNRLRHGYRASLGYKYTWK